MCHSLKVLIHGRWINRVNQCDPVYSLRVKKYPNTNRVRDYTLGDSQVNNSFVVLTEGKIVGMLFYFIYLGVV